MTYFDILADTGAGLERVDIADNVNDAQKIADALHASGATWVLIEYRRF